MKIKAEYVIYVLITLILFCIIWYLLKSNCLWSLYNHGEGMVNENNNLLIESKDLKDIKCVCAFDIDHTISCGDPKPYVDACVRNGCKIALNTARPLKYVDDVDIVGMGMVEPYYSDEDFYYNPNSYFQTSIQVAEVKSGFLQLLQNKYKIKDKNCIILLDDNEYNIDVAKSNNFGTIKASRSKINCGLSKTDLETFNNKLTKCSYQLRASGSEEAWYQS